MLDLKIQAKKITYTILSLIVTALLYAAQLIDKLRTNLVLG